MSKYPELENLAKIAKTLDRLKIPYYITGGFAVSQYGRSRFTADVDIVIKMSQPDIIKIDQEFRAIFPSGYIDQDQIARALKDKSEFNIIDPESGLKIDFFIAKENAFEQSAFSRILDKNYDYDIKFISPEDLIISKLLWFRESESTRQLEDIASVLETQKKLDQKYISDWVNKIELQAEWQKLKELKKWGIKNPETCSGGNTDRSRLLK